MKIGTFVMRKQKSISPDMDRTQNGQSRFR